MNATSMDVNKKIKVEEPDKKRSGRISDIWIHFSKVEGGNQIDPRCVCNYCGKDYACDSRKIGTSSLWNHIKKQCKKYSGRVTDKNQKVLSFQTGGDGVGNLLAKTFNKEKSRLALAKFVVTDEQPFSVVEGQGFRDLIQELQPKLEIPGRMTVTRDTFKLFCEERDKLKKELTKGGQRVCLTTDCWTSCTQLAYMCLTAHYIDSDWHLNKKIINFCLVKDHKGETIGRVIEVCLLGWGLEKVFSMTVDNASANDVVVAYVRKRINAWKGSVLDGEFIHLRCGAHIVNLIVGEGLKEMHDSIAAIRNSVRYIRSSPSRLQKFRSCIEREKITYKGGLVLDVPTRWNSTFMMLDAALKFEKAFVSYGDEDDKYLRHFEEKENEKKIVGPPNPYHWQCASAFVKFLSTFYEVTLKFSGTLHVTSNNFYHEICEIHTHLNSLVKSKDSILSTMATSMKKKFDKYWGNPDIINPLLFLAVVLDPRYKMKYLKFLFESIYDGETVAKVTSKVEGILNRLFEIYNAKYGGGDEVTEKESATPINEINKRTLLESYMQKQQLQVPEKMNDVQRYLGEESLDPMTPKFDILLWWKVNATRYVILSMIAKDILAIPISTVASESAFSTSGRILDSFRSSLSPKMVEALVCTQSWLKVGHQGIQTKEYLDEASSYEFVKEDDMSNLKTKKLKMSEVETANAVIVD